MVQMFMAMKLSSLGSPVAICATSVSPLSVT